MSVKSLVTIDQVKKILLADKGPDASLESWYTEEFTKAGDNYVCSVIGVKIKYTINSKTDEESYVAKLNPQQAEGYEQMNQDVFINESEFYMSVLPVLNEVMKDIEQPQLNFPRCFHKNLVVNEEQLYFEDLRKKDFVLFDRKKGMSIAHANLVLKELARFHASSLVLESKLNKPLEEKFECLNWDLISTDYFKTMMHPMLLNGMNRAMDMLKTAEGYDKAIHWIENLKPQVDDIFASIKSEAFNVICHGDCWNNNVLFRYDAGGNPVKVMLIDLQVMRKASFATDLTYFMYASLAGDIRRPNLQSFLNTYYEQFQMVVEAAGLSMPFTEQELFQEYKSKSVFSSMFMMVMLPIILLEFGQVAENAEHHGDIAKIIDEAGKTASSTMKDNPMFKLRFLAMFDELIDMGIIT